jgi:predicted XRE-type DNA-binding protein
MTAKSAKRVRKSTARQVARARRGTAAHSRLRTSPHVTPSSGNVFLDLGFSSQEAENLKIRSLLMSKLRELIVGLTQVSAAELLGVSQPRISDLKRGKIGLFTIDALVNMLASAGVELHVSVSRSAA